MLSEAKTGLITANDGTINALRSSKEGGLVVVSDRGRYTESTYRGRVFFAANSATQALSVNNTTATGLILTNPAGSNKNLSILEINVALASLPAGQSTLILTGSNNPAAAAVTHTTPLTVRNAFVGAFPGAGVGLVDSAATIPAANIFRIIGAGTAATVAASTAFPPYIKDDVGGLLILSPGTCISLQALTTAITVVASIVWEEIAL